MKLLTILAFTLALVTATAKPTLAHVDSLGQPDPYWQQLAAATAGADAAGPPDTTAPLADFVSFGGLSLLLLCLGIALALDLATAPARLRAAPAAGPTTEAPTPGPPDETACEQPVRTVEVVPPSASGETRHVLRLAATIVLAVIVVSALHASDRGTDSAPPARGLAPFQVPVGDATPTVRRMFSEIEEGLIQAEQIRSTTNRWPAVETLAAQGIRPFPLADSSYRWRLLQDGAYAAYVGTPTTTGSDAPALLALIREFAPGDVAGTTATTPPGELAHRLSDGTPLRVSIWFRPDGSAADTQATMAAVAQPSATGWKQILAGK